MLAGGPEFLYSDEVNPSYFSFNHNINTTGDERLCNGTVSKLDSTTYQCLILMVLYCNPVNEHLHNSLVSISGGNM
jgi:hypothetical protein